MKFICIYQYFFVPLQRLLISKPFSYSGQPFQESSQKFTIFKIASQLSSQPFSVLVISFNTPCEGRIVSDSLEIPWWFVGCYATQYVPKE